MKTFSYAEFVQSRSSTCSSALAASRFRRLRVQIPDFVPNRGRIGSGTIAPAA
jgi:hypothetical protein